MYVYVCWSYLLAVLTWEKNQVRCQLINLTNGLNGTNGPTVVLIVSPWYANLFLLNLLLFYYFLFFIYIVIILHDLPMATASPMIAKMFKICHIINHTCENN